MMDPANNVSGLDLINTYRFTIWSSSLAAAYPLYSLRGVVGSLKVGIRSSIINELMMLSDHKWRLYRDWSGALSGLVFSYVTTDRFGAYGESSVCRSSNCTFFLICRAGSGDGSIGAIYTSNWSPYSSSLQRVWSPISIEWRFSIACI